MANGTLWNNVYELSTVVVVVSEFCCTVVCILNFIAAVCRGCDLRDVTVLVIVINYNVPRGRSKRD